MRAKLVAPPDWMNALQRRVWTNTLANAPQGMLRTLDEGTFATWVVAYALYQETAQKLSKKKSLTEKTTKGNTVQSVHLSILNRQALIMMKAASELGFSPTSRTRIKVPQGQEESNPFAKHGSAKRNA